MEASAHLILLGAGFLVASIVASAVSARVGAPLLLVFLLVGMLAGQEGLFGVAFADIPSAHLIGTLALAVILLYALAYTLELAVALALYFSGEPRETA